MTLIWTGLHPQQKSSVAGLASEALPLGNKWRHAQRASDMAVQQ